MGDSVKIFEVGPRDGLQNEQKIISAEKKIKLVDKLSDCGFLHIEVTSFVSPKWVPQMADAAEVLAGINRKAGVVYSALTPNLRGFEAAMAAGASEVAIFGSASEGFSQKNINCSISESIKRFSPIISAAKFENVKVRGYVSCVTDCPYDGKTAPESVLSVAETMLEMGCYEISLGDTIGAGTPESVGELLSLMLNHIPAEKLAGHFHDTNNRALDNIKICLDAGIRSFDSAVGGLGGCPYAKGAKGNVDTLKVVEMLENSGFKTGIDMEKLHKTAEFALSLRGG